jgi:hypothetical protein
MNEFFAQMEPLLRTFWFIALPASLVFLIQMVMTFIGADASDGTSPDFDGNFDGDAPFQLFSLRNLINFLLGFGWTGVGFYTMISSKGLLIALAFVIGSGMVAVFFYLMKVVSGLAEDNTFKIADTVGKSAQVYLSIPADKTGRGKIQISVHGSVHEIEAVTSGARLDTGTMVRVESVVDNNLVQVTKL